MLLNAVHSTTRTKCPPARLVSGGRQIMAFASSFRQGRAAQCLVRLAPTSASDPTASKSEPNSMAVMERIPDAFVITDTTLAHPLSVNTAFLDMTGIAAKEQAVGQQLSQFLGRAGLDRNILVDNLARPWHGAEFRHRPAQSVRQTRKTWRCRRRRSTDDRPGGLRLHHSWRPASPKRTSSLDRARKRRRSVGQLTELDRTHKDPRIVVRESTDLVERLCIDVGSWN